MSLKDVIPPHELWRYAQAIEADYAEQARAIQKRLGVPDRMRRGVTNDFPVIPDPNAVQRQAVEAASNELVGRLRDKDIRHA